MTKSKRFQNPLKSAPQPQCHAYPPTRAPVHSSPSIHTQPETLIETPSTHAPPYDLVNPLPTIQVPPHAPVNFAPTVEIPEHVPTQPFNSTSSSRCAGRESTQHWTVEAIDSEGAIKKIKLKVKEVNNLCSGDRIIVNFDEYDAAYGEAQGLLAGYCGTLATDCKLFPIHFERWSATFPIPTPKNYFNDCFETIIKPRFCFRTTEGIAKRYCNASIGDKWAAHRQKLWNDFYDTSMTRDEIISNVSRGIERDQWVTFIHYRLKPSTQELCRRNKEIRSKQTIPHTGGSKPNSRRRNEIFLETGQKISRGKMYKITHTKKDGSFVSTAAMDKVEAIDQIITQSTNDESEISPNDVVGKVFGEEHSGRVRTMGMGAAPTNTFRNTRLRLSNVSHSSAENATSSFTQWQERYLRLENALKAYMIMKEGSIPEELADFFAPQPEPGDASSEPTTPLDARRSSGGSNTNHQ